MDSIAQKEDLLERLPDLEKDRPLQLNASPSQNDAGFFWVCLVEKVLDIEGGLPIVSAPPSRPYVRPAIFWNPS